MAHSVALTNGGYAHGHADDGDRRFKRDNGKGQRARYVLSTNVSRLAASASLPGHLGAVGGLHIEFPRPLGARGARVDVSVVSRTHS